MRGEGDQVLTVKEADTTKCSMLSCDKVLPYLPFTLEEVACIRSLDNWSNCKARVVGRVTGLDPATCRGRLTSAGEGITAVIRICLKAIPDKVLDTERGDLVQCLGQLEMFRGDPILRVHILRSMTGLDTEAYYRAVCRIQPELPCNIIRP